MKKQAKKNKGITLIALAITIIVLLILAGVAIATLTGDNGLLTKASNAKQTTTDAEIKEQIRLAWNKVYADSYLSSIDDKATALTTELDKNGYTTVVVGNDTDGYIVTYNGIDYLLLVTGTIEKIGKQTKWIDNGDGTFTYSENGTKVKIGDKVNYNELSNGTKTYTTDITKGIGGSLGNFGNKDTNGKYVLESKIYTTEDLSWRVLGINENGKIELISEDPMSDTNEVFLANEEGYLYAETKEQEKGTLDKMCYDLYRYGNGAESARSLNVEDLNKLAGINSDEDKRALNSDYKNKVYMNRFPTAQESRNRNMQYRRVDNQGGWMNLTSSELQTFRMPGASKDSTISSENPGYSQEYTSDWYRYEISKKILQKTAKGENISDIISKGTTSSNINQFIASTCVMTNNGNLLFEIFCIYNGEISQGGLFASNEANYMHNFRLRPIVLLKSNVELNWNQTLNQWDIQ